MSVSDDRSVRCPICDSLVTFESGFPDDQILESKQAEIRLENHMAEKHSKTELALHGLKHKIQEVFA